jgi:hypothetical protein
MISRPTQTMWLVAPAQESPAGGGRRGRVKAKAVENKKEDMKDYMERAAALVQQYVPPQPADIQRAKDAGKVSAHRPAPVSDGSSFLLPGDDRERESRVYRRGVRSEFRLLSSAVQRTQAACRIRLDESQNRLLLLRVGHR